MKDWDLHRSVTSMQVMTRYASERGMSLEACLDGTGLSPENLANPDTLVTGHQELRLAANLVAHFDGEPALGVEIGTRYHFTSIGVLGLAVASSPTMRAAMDMALRYLSLTFAFTPLAVEDDGTEYRIVADDSALPRHLRQFLLERHASTVFRLQREVFPSANPIQALHFRFPQPARINRYKEILGLMPQFGRERNQIIADSRLMSVHSTLANESSRRMAEEQCRKLLATRRSRSSYAEKVRELILRHLANAPGMHIVAGELCMTPRTLRRRLLCEGTTFAALLEEVRQTVAEELLATPGITVEQVAGRLGYAATSSFILAFKRWKGQPPTVYRRRQSRPTTG